MYALKRLCLLPIVSIALGCTPWQGVAQSPPPTGDVQNTPARTASVATPHHATARPQPTLSSPTQQPLPPDTAMTLVRLPCMGSCPVYTLHIQANGDVQFTGTQYVKAQGTQTAHLPAEEVQHLVAQFTALHFFTLHDFYGKMGDCTVYATDTDSLRLTLRMASQEKTVEGYLGCVEGRDAEGLVALGELMDTTVNSAQWISAS
jgi:hypothetical protein